MAGANCPLRLCDQGVAGRGPHPSFRARITDENVENVSKETYRETYRGASVKVKIVQTQNVKTDTQTYRETYRETNISSGLMHKHVVKHTEKHIGPS
jgi:hypothetical protein